VAEPRLHFLTSDRPLLPQAVEWLAESWDGTGPLDLSALLVVVPTKQSGRRLREALAERAARHGQAALPPQVTTPEGLIVVSPAARAASRLQSLVAWIELFQEFEPAEFREVFPLDPPARNFSWALRLAEQFVKLQKDLGEGGLRLADVAAKAGDFPEAARWRQLGELEQRQEARLAALGLGGLQAARISAAAGPQAVAATRIVVLAVPDPLPLAITALEGLGRSLPVEIGVFARPEERGSFDAWGRPRTASWEKRELHLEAFAQHVTLCADPAAQADRVAALAFSYGKPSGRLGVGVTDPEVLPVLEVALARAHFPVFNPEGESRRQDGLHHLLATLAALAEEPSFPAVAALARCPDFMDFLAARVDGFSVSRWLRGLDELHSRHLPADLAAARLHAPKLPAHAELEPGLAAVEEIRQLLRGPSFPDGAAGALGAIFAARQLDLARPADARILDSAEAWRQVVEECARLAGTLKTAEWWELALRLYGAATRTEEKPDGAVELQGWLELLFEDAPHLVVAGCNDGMVPEAVAGDPFLPEGLREKLGLKTNGARLARDAYVLAVLEDCRRSGGRLDLLVGKVSAAGDPLRPSRLLLQCSDAELPARVAWLFRDLAAGRPGPSWRRAWQLRPPRVPAPTRLRVTAFRDYLQCPFRFYLKHGLKLSTVDLHKAELDAPDFGTLCHSALEAMAGEPSLRASADAAELRDFLHRALEREIHARYGANLTLPLLVQVESARQRLARAADIQAAQRAEGWLIEHAEKKISLQIGPIGVDGKIDRIERNERTGQRRVLDYKTADQPVSPLEAHARRLGRNDAEVPAYARFLLRDKEWMWKDLQLPLYLEALGREGPVAAGYFNLPKAAGDTAVSVWDGYDDFWRDTARRCAEGVATAIAAGVFWPPAERLAREDPLFAGWFHRGTADSVVSPFPPAVGDLP
jgi:ATP-dependent helicase/nuclease subunit B